MIKEYCEGPINWRTLMIDESFLIFNLLIVQITLEYKYYVYAGYVV